ncbi:MAG: hypothetical protein QME51_09430 [Planctomycetota bacterium]|nr:hypothetical protein [Planctomycetota bacterium]
MKSNDLIMKHLHKIREEHYEKVKNLSPREQLVFDAKKVSEIKQKYALDLPKNTLVLAVSHK